MKTKMESRGQSVRLLVIYEDGSREVTYHFSNAHAQKRLEFCQVFYSNYCDYEITITH